MAALRTTEDARPKLDQEQVVTAADRLIAERGWDALTMAALADELGVRAPSLYRHVESLDALRLLLQLRSVAELGDATRDAVMGRSGEDGLRALADAYREYAHRHPERYLAHTRRAGNEELREAGRRAGEAAHAVLRSFGLAEADIPVATAQLAAMIHGFVSLELVHTIDWVPDPGRAYIGMIDTFAAGLRNR